VQNELQLVLLAKEETVLQDTIDRLIEIGTFHGMEINVEKTMVMGISRELSPLHFMVGEKQLGNMEYFNYLGSIVTNDARYKREIKSRIGMAKQHSRRKIFSPANCT
jgi:hypothetical protein